METKNAVAALAALAQESRLAVFRLLIQAGLGGMAAGKISEAAGIAPSSLSFHLKELVHAGMVTARQEGRFVIYAANFATAADLVAFLTENCCGGNPCLPIHNPVCTPPKKAHHETPARTRRRRKSG
jgi:DNA-binding transcriptional ArsR family regulator